MAKALGNAEIVLTHTFSEALVSDLQRRPGSEGALTSTVVKRRASLLLRIEVVSQPYRGFVRLFVRRLLLLYSSRCTLVQDRRRKVALQ